MSFLALEIGIWFYWGIEPSRKNMLNLSGNFDLLWRDKRKLIPIFAEDLLADPEGIKIDSFSIFFHALSNGGLLFLLTDALDDEIVRRGG